MQGKNSNFTRTDRTTLSRIPTRAEYDKDIIYQILDEAFICHVGFIFDGKPYVIPTAYTRIDDDLYIHGAPASRMLKVLQSGIETCIVVTLLDGLVLARSAFHHSLNYRSVIIFGLAKLVAEPERKLQILRAFSEHIVRNRWQDVREPNQKELAATTILSVPLQEVSAKIRSGPPLDDDEDMDLPVWAGEIPVKLMAGEPVTATNLVPGVDLPDYARNYSRHTKF
jgi:uncharacterized protein